MSMHVSRSLLLASRVVNWRKLNLTHGEYCASACRHLLPNEVTLGYEYSDVGVEVRCRARGGWPLKKLGVAMVACDLRASSISTVAVPVHDAASVAERRWVCPRLIEE